MITPPRTPELLLQSFGASTQFLEPLLGDLAEGFASRVERDGVGRARRWYYREALRAAPHVLREGVGGLHAGDIKHVAGVVFAAYCLVLMLGVLASMVGGAIMSTWQVAPAQFARNGPLFYVGYALGFGCTMMGGVIAAWLDERRPLVSALALGLLWASMGVASMALGHGSETALLRIVIPSMTVTGVMLGALLRIRALTVAEQR